MTGMKFTMTGFTTLYIVRHAEKAIAEPDPALTERGRRRALALAHRMAEVALDAIWSTDWLRTVETVTPTARLHVLNIQVYATQQGPDLCREIVGRPASTVLIAAHSNTIDELMDALALTLPFKLDESRYGDLLIVTIEAGKAKLQLDRFGP